MNHLKYSICVIVAILGLQPVLAQTNQAIVTGFVTDTLSGRRGANALHIDAAKRNVASGMASYALYDEKTKKLYILGQQDTAAANLGQRVTVTGILAPSPMAHAGQGVDPKTGQAVDFHRLVQDSTTPIAGVLTNFTIAVTPYVPKSKPKSP